MLNNTYYNEFFEIGQQKINFSLYELGLPEADPVYTLKKVMEELDYSGLLSRYSDKGRKGYNPIMLYAVVTYANMRGIRAVDRIVELCGRDLAFIWLTQGQKPKRDAFYEFKGSRRFLHGKSRNLERSQGNLPHRESAPCIGQRPICVSFKYCGKEKDI